MIERLWAASSNPECQVVTQRRHWQGSMSDQLTKQPPLGTLLNVGSWAAQAGSGGQSQEARNGMASLAGTRGGAVRGLLAVAGD